MTKILITGGAGYLGSILVPELLKLDYEVTVVDNFMYKQNSLLDYCMNPNFKIIRGDARDENLMKNLVKDKDYVLPFAALVGAPISSRDPFGTVWGRVDICFYGFVHARIFKVNAFKRYYRVIF